MDIGRISIIVEVDGKPCAVVLPKERMRMLINQAAALSDNGKLPVKRLGDDFIFIEID